VVIKNTGWIDSKRVTMENGTNRFVLCSGSAAGDPVVIKNAVCLHEEDHGLLWKHLDYR
jgi:Cu2+-containing amine oxidase